MDKVIDSPFKVLGTSLEVTNYSELTNFCKRQCNFGRVIAIDFSNTQIVTMRRHENWFRKLTSKIDYFIPDGMPLVWCLNLQGAGMKDRVYGPTFFRESLLKMPSPFKHYLLGGSPECGEKLRQQILKWNPAVEIVGAFHGKSDVNGRLEGEADQRVVDEINALSPDFIWVGLGTPKQYGWIDRNKMKINRGVLLSVGFAFDVNAGTKKDAPLWMQKAGLTWLFRLCSEPRRLASRYFRYNSLFLFYLVWDGLRDRVFRSTFHGKNS